MKASPGRGKLSLKVTDEGAGKQQLTGNSPSSVIADAMPPSPPRGKAFALGQAAKVDRRELHPRNRTVYMAIQPKAFATELARMIAAKMGHSQRIIKLNTGLRRNR